MFKKRIHEVVVLMLTVALSLIFVQPANTALETQLLVDVSPSSDYVPYQQTQWYGFTATGGNGYCAILTPSTGNGDLYLFDTGFNLRTSSKNTGLTADKVWYGQSTSGLFHLACYGVYNPSSNFTIQVITAPYVSTISPTSGAAGTLVTINGFGFGATQGTSYVKFGTVQATSYYSWNNTQIKVYVPPGVAGGIIQAVVYVASKASNPMNFTVSAVSSDGTMWRYDLARTANHPDGPAALPLSLKWYYANISPVNDSSPVVANNTLYVGIDIGLLAIDATTGSIKWSRSSGAYAAFMSTSPAITDNIVYICAGGALHAFDTNGNLKWKVNPPGGASRSPVVYNGLVYSAGYEKVHALDANTGAIKWSFTAVGETFDYAPAIANGIIYIASDRKTYALNANTGSLKWSYVPPEGELDGNYDTTETSIVVNNSVVYVVSDIYRKVYALDANTGSLKWSYVAGGRITTSCAIDKAKGILYFCAEGYKLYALDATTGILKWTYDVVDNIGMFAIHSSPVVSNGIVYFAADNGKLYALDGVTGILRWGYDFGKHGIPAAPGIANGRVYISVQGMGVYCFGQ